MSEGEQREQKVSKASTNEGRMKSTYDCRFLRRVW